MVQKPQLLDTAQAAEFIGMSVAFLECSRSRGVIGNRTPPPPHIKLGRRCVRYDVKDLEAWLAAQRVDPATRKPESLRKTSRPTAGNAA